MAFRGSFEQLLTVKLLFKQRQNMTMQNHRLEHSKRSKIDCIMALKIRNEQTKNSCFILFLLSNIIYLKMFKIPLLSQIIRNAWVSSKLFYRRHNVLEQAQTARLQSCLDFYLNISSIQFGWYFCVCDKFERSFGKRNCMHTSNHTTGVRLCDIPDFCTQISVVYAYFFLHLIKSTNFTRN